MTFGDKLINLRKQRKLTQDECAEKIGVTRQTVSNWELNRTKPDLEQLKGISKFYKISLDELVDNEATEKVSSIEKNVLPEGYTSTIFNYREVNNREQDLIACIERKEIDSAYAYSGYNVTKKCVHLMCSKSYRIYHDSINLIQKNLETIINVFNDPSKPIRIICLGIGDGSKDAVILKKIIQEKKRIRFGILGF